MDKKKNQKKILDKIMEAVKHVRKKPSDIIIIRD
jgi:hypothetical protein